ncbi:MAG: CvpA family protein [Candidatus Limnocylindrales bacterium]
MDLGTFLQSLTAADLALLLIYAGVFVLGFFQGGTRALLGLLAWLFAFVIGVTVWQPLGEWLNGSWTLYTLVYNQMLAFLIGFIVALVIGAIVIVTFTKRSPLLPRWPFADEVLGGVLFVVLALLITGSVMLAFDTSYPMGVSSRADVPWLTSIAESLQASVIGGWINATIVPFLLTVFGPIIPDEFERLASGPA